MFRVSRVWEDVGAPSRVFETPDVSVMLTMSRGTQYFGCSTFVLSRCPKNWQCQPWFGRELRVWWFQGQHTSSRSRCPISCSHLSKRTRPPLGSSPSLHKVLAANRLFVLNISRAIWGDSSFRSLTTSHREGIESQTLYSNNRARPKVQVEYTAVIPLTLESEWPSTDSFWHHFWWHGKK